MKPKRLIKRLKGHFGRKARKKLKREKTLEGLVDRMLRMERKLESSHADEESRSRRRLLEKQLVVLRAQRRKAQELLA